MCLSKIYQTNAARYLPPPCGAYRRPCSQTHHAIKNPPTPNPQARLSIRPSPASPTRNASAVPIRPSSKIRARPRHSKKLSPGSSKHYADKCGLSALAPQGLKSNRLKALISATAPHPLKTHPLPTPNPQARLSIRPSPNQPSPATPPLSRFAPPQKSAPVRGTPKSSAPAHQNIMPTSAACPHLPRKGLNPTTSKPAFLPLRPSLKNPLPSTQKKPHTLNRPTHNAPHLHPAAKNPSGFSDLLNISLLKCQQV